MAMSVIWTAAVGLSLVYSLFAGTAPQVGAAAVEGAGAAVELCLGMAGMLCLWSGVLEVMTASGLAAALERLLRPVLGWLYPGCRGDREALEAASANLSANLLGLGSAATPPGLRAARRMARLSPDSLCMLVVCASASVQLIPTTVASVRAAAGCAVPFDILPAVWLTSGASVTAGVLAAKVMARLWRR